MRGAIGQNHAIPGVGGAWQRHKRGGGRRSRPFLGLERVPVTGGTALRPPPRRNRRRRELRRTVGGGEGAGLGGKKKKKKGASPPPLGRTQRRQATPAAPLGRGGHPNLQRAG
ncbi:radiation-inducible immediate-early gene IEX-1 isoform X2 [Onychostruthus taczanowskii]|uniref:radiation-inducible immediate-early gene IEX-1 isoform X2 n=1 Tax=Onychostruthus taczanowskii TaxID=356909 RepID=UPI001B80B7F1|nr:radiation-inducible immediate-early gene IEX-1 isoform X2 [Onychostruthus taczanowskii]